MILEALQESIPKRSRVGVYEVRLLIANHRGEGGIGMGEGGEL